ncbi:hypothetical protein SMD11_1015 [Streptomyces albireticuli]|uniref:Uncharacterized protein n=1 Tax=Streptomyces albireticuli TaxID=1940 RepID=A0A1Z2KXC5_9ACTN|nr:hypothetical protein [Streptomyces albireticuli]ARZ66680.1 hypothetical protein SMD11_1015 [Streptomyces albireticuli]
MMLEELVLAGGTTVVGAMATDSWAVARGGIARLFGRRGEDQQSAVEAWLDNNAALVARAGDAERVRRSLLPVWLLELESLLEAHPDAAGEPRELINELRDRLPDDQRAGVQNSVAKDRGQVFAVQGGDIIAHQTPPGRRGRGDAQ